MSGPTDELDERETAAGAKSRRGSVAEVFLAFRGLGLTSFGGPVAHLGDLREAFVVRRKWLAEPAYADLVALCHFLPGPASSQVGIALGLMRAGYSGALAAWAAFTLPSVLLLLGFAYGVSTFSGPLMAGALHGLKIAALAVVAQAVWQMARSLTPDWPRRLVAIAAAAAVLLAATGVAQIAAIALAGLLGAALGRTSSAGGDSHVAETGSRGIALACLTLFLVLLAALPLLAAMTGDPALSLADRFYRTGSLVFGGGHVVLPLLEAELVEPGLIDRDLFLAGDGAAQAVPGPLFAFAAYAGALLKSPPNGLAGSALALAAIYLPTFLLVFGALPFWQRLRRFARLRSAMDFANAAVVGLLLAALYDPVFTSAVGSPLDFAFALAAVAMLALLRVPPWLVVILSGAAGVLLQAIGG